MPTGSCACRLPVAAAAVLFKIQHVSLASARCATHSVTTAQGAAARPAGGAAGAEAAGDEARQPGRRVRAAGVHHGGGAAAAAPGRGVPGAARLQRAPRVPAGTIAPGWAPSCLHAPVGCPDAVS